MYGAATALLESSILTEESWSLWRCSAARTAVKSGYGLAIEMEGNSQEREGGGTTVTERQISQRIKKQSKELRNFDITNFLILQYAAKLSHSVAFTSLYITQMFKFI